MTADRSTPSARKTELLEASYQYALRAGLADLSLRPLATAIGSSPGVLIFLFGSKEGLVRALLARARQDELALLADVGQGDLATVARQVWRWLAVEEHRPLLRLWLQAYALSVADPEGPWAGFAQATVTDWLSVLATAQPLRSRHSKAGAAQRTLVLAILRGALLDLLATDDVERTTAAVRLQLAQISRRSLAQRESS